MLLRDTHALLFEWVIPYMYLRKKGPIGSAPYIGPRLGDEPTFKVLVLQLDSKEHPDKLPTGYSNSNHSIILVLFNFISPIKSEGSQLSG